MELREVAAVDLFPRSGGIMRIDLGDQIQNQKTLAQCEYYSQLKQKAEEKVAQSEDATVDSGSKSAIIDGNHHSQITHEAGHKGSQRL
jgi:hypothetical protein